MRAELDAAVADVERRWNEGRLPWTYATVQSLITPYPRRGQLDKLLPGQEDEATPDPDGVPWTVDDHGPGGSEHDDDSAGDERGFFADDADCDPDVWMADGALQQQHEAHCRELREHRTRGATLGSQHGVWSPVTDERRDVGATTAGAKGYGADRVWGAPSPDAAAGVRRGAHPASRVSPLPRG